MGNKIINISNSTGEAYDSSKNLEVYRDLSMMAERKNRQYLINNNDTIKTGYRQMLTVTKDVNVKAIFNSIRNIFSWIPGERILNPEFGSRLQYYLYEGITDSNVEQIMAEIRGICLRWEPRINIVKVVNAGTVDDTEDNTVRLDVIFTIPSLSDEQYTYSYIYNRAS